MVLYKKEIPVINNIINNTFSETINLKNVCIAGGFANSIYLNYLLSKDSFDNKSKLAIDLLDRSPNKLFNRSFGDIDIWNIGDEDNKCLNQERLTLKRTSDWCDTYDFSFVLKNASISLDLQIMKNNPESISELISGFDINCCCIAWSNNKVYYNESYNKFLQSKKLSFNKTPVYDKEEDVLYYLDRLVKYIEKYKYSIEREVSSYIAQEYCKIKDFDLSKHDISSPHNSSYGVVHTTRNQYKEYKSKIILCLRNIIMKKKVHPSLFAFLINDENFSFTIKTMMSDSLKEATLENIPF